MKSIVRKTEINSVYWLLSTSVLDYYLRHSIQYLYHTITFNCTCLNGKLRFFVTFYTVQVLRHILWNFYTVGTCMWHIDTVYSYLCFLDCTYCQYCIWICLYFHFSPCLHVYDILHLQLVYVNMLHCTDCHLSCNNIKFKIISHIYVFLFTDCQLCWAWSGSYLTN